VRVKSSQLGRKPGFVLRESILRSLIFFPRLARKNHAKAEATSSLRRNLFYVSCQTVARAKEINVLPSGAKTGAIDRLWRRFCGKCSKHPAVPGDSLKHRLASNLPFSRSSQVSSPVRPPTRLLRRRILARRPDYSQCGTNKGSSSIGFPPSGPARARSPAVMTHSNRAALLYLSQFVAERLSCSAPLVPRPERA
jgi:hypothetical protein